MSEDRDTPPDLDELTRLVHDLLLRVERLERQAAISPSARIAAPIREIPRRSSPQDWESRIGSNWLNRVGIVAVLIEVSYFLKYAFESNWIGSATRVVGALAVGIAVVIWSEWFRTRGYRIFSFSLKAVGLGVLYLAVWAAFQLYRLIPLQLAFAALILVTAATVVLALCQDAAIVAFFALVGGFATPLLVSSTGQEVQLFTYLLVLDFATLLLAVFRRWPRLLLSLVGALTLYFAGYAGYYRRDELQLTITFATLSSPCSPSRQW